MDDISVKEYVDKLLEVRDHFLDLRWQTAIHNSELTMAALDKRLESMNEIRQQLNVQAATFATREFTEVTFQRVDERIRNLQTYRANMEGRTWAVGAGFTLLNIIIAGFALWR